MESQIGDRKRSREDQRSTTTSRREPVSRGRHRSVRFQTHRRPQRHERGSDSPSLLDFAPDLLSKLGSPPPTQDARGRRHSTGSQDSPLRSPLHKSRRGLQETTPLRGRRAPHNRANHSARQISTRVRREADVTPLAEDSALSLPGDRRARKCLWADEVDAASMDCDTSDNHLVASEPPKPPTDEQLARRQKDIDFGKATQGYHNYLQRVPRDQRGNLCPQTPDKTGKFARRVWDNAVRHWRRSLHQWDAPKRSPSTSPFTSPTQIAARRPDKTLRPKRLEGLCPSPSDDSSSDKGHNPDPSDSLHAAWLDQFPPLQPGADKWWELMDQETKKTKQRETGQDQETGQDLVPEKTWQWGTSQDKGQGGQAAEGTSQDQGQGAEGTRQDQETRQEGDQEKGKEGGVLEDRKGQESDALNQSVQKLTLHGPGSAGIEEEKENCQ